VHGYNASSDPNHTPGSKLPPSAIRAKFWNQCQHQSWFFLPWHRGYLACFEAIIAAAVVKLGGPAAWALPYWNYSDTHDPTKARQFPSAFAGKTLNDGTHNPLWVAARVLSSLRDIDVSLDCLTHPPFTGTASGGEHGFGGVKTIFSHFGGTNGRLENVPHNAIHDRVGGLMGDPDTAALDPIFWLHHSNIDRLWEVWRHRDPTFQNPTVAPWLTGVSFDINDGSGHAIKFNASQMGDTTKVLHGYTYDDISDPIPAIPHLHPMAKMAASMAQSPQAPELVAASTEAISLDKAVATTRVAFNKPSAHAARMRVSAKAATRPTRAYLNLENVTGLEARGTYQVFINIEGGNLQGSGEHGLFAGLLTTFGVAAASRRDGQHAGSGITTVLEITHLVEQLRQQGRWDESHLQVSFVKDDTGSAAAAGASDLKVGRVSVYYS
jgi:tyrosinase